MGTKYIIEVEDKPFELLSEDGFTSEKLFRVKGFNSLVFDWNGLNKLTPYTEPDLGQVRKEAYKIGYEKGYRDGVNRIGDAEDKIRREAYQKGYETGYEDGYNEPGKNQQEAYQRGLSDAWEAARKLYEIDWDVFCDLFGKVSVRSEVLDMFTASEVIEKLKAYEQEQETIQVGDEVELKCGVRPAIYMQGTKGSDEIYLLFNDGSCGLHSKSEIERKTGRHFPEIATILENMRGEQDG